MEANIEDVIETGKLVTEIANYARDNESFKEKLTAEPHSTIDEYVGRNDVFPKSSNIVVNEFNSAEVYFTIPRKVDPDDFELSDLELETISGGSDLVTGILAAIITIELAYIASEVT